jgi:biotin carboxylase
VIILCIASYEKGHDFLRECKRQGWTVLLITSQSLQENAHWPADSIDEIFYMPDPGHKWDRDQTLRAVSYLARTRQIDRLVPLDDFDLEMAATLREHLRIPGMGETTTRYFRDKLAMRMRACEGGLDVPDFVHILNYDRIREFLDRVPPPWVLKPRSMAGSIGIKKVHSSAELWGHVERLGDEQSNYLLERFVAGDIFHVDSIIYERQILFACASGYGTPPLEVSQGGVFTTSLLERGSEMEQVLLEKNRQVLKTLGLLRGVSHTEFIRAHEGGKIYFLETSARVGGAHIADLIENATGINMWAEWAKVEIAGGKAPYQPGATRQDYAGLIVSLSRQPQPDTSAYIDSELVWRLKKEHHVGMIVRSPDHGRVRQLLDSYVARVREDFQATAPPLDRPAS